MVDPRSDRPMYRQIADELRDAIRNGDIADGDLLPSEAVLVKRYRVSQNTARKALTMLRQEGLTNTVKGKGVIVRAQPTVIRLATDRFARAKRKTGTGRGAYDVEMKDRGLVPVSEVEVEGPLTPTAEVAELLKLEDGGRVVARRRRMLADGEPLQLATSYVPWSIAEGTQIAEKDSGPGGIYARIEDLGHELAEFEEELGARAATPEEADELGLDSGAPVLLLTRVAFDTAGMPVEVCDCVMVAGRYRLKYRFPQI